MTAAKRTVLKRKIVHVEGIELAKARMRVDRTWHVTRRCIWSIGSVGQQNKGTLKDLGKESQNQLRKVCLPH